jgi:predicted nucleic acid-binding Zn ribbon protein
MTVSNLKQILNNISPNQRRSCNPQIKPIINDILNNTKFLNENASISERIFYILNNIQNQITCPICGKKCIYYSGRINKFCSNKCVGLYNTSLKSPNILVKNICTVCNTAFDYKYHKKTCSVRCQNISISLRRQKFQFNKHKYLIHKNISLDQLLEQTSFLKINTHIQARIHCINNNIISEPLCINCGLKCVKFHFKPTPHFGTYCSSKCCNSHTAKINKTKKKLFEKYGVISTSQLKSTKEKFKQTCILKYGGPSPMHDYNIVAKMIQTRIINHGDMFIPNIGNNEKKILDAQEIIDNCKIDRNFKVSIFSPDGYCHETNTIYEVYEKYHKYPKQHIKDLKRQIFIKNKLKCNFIILWDI